MQTLQEMHNAKTKTGNTTIVNSTNFNSFFKAPLQQIMGVVQGSVGVEYYVSCIDSHTRDTITNTRTDIIIKLRSQKISCSQSTRSRCTYLTKYATKLKIDIRSLDAIISELDGPTGRCEVWPIINFLWRSDESSESKSNPLARVSISISTINGDTEPTVAKRNDNADDNTSRRRRTSTV